MINLLPNEKVLIGAGVVDVLAENMTECVLFFNDNDELIDSGYCSPKQVVYLGNIYAMATVHGTKILTCGCDKSVGNSSVPSTSSGSAPFVGDSALFGNIQGGDYMNKILRVVSDSVMATLNPEVTKIQFTFGGGSLRVEGRKPLSFVRMDDKINLVIGETVTASHSYFSSEGDIVNMDLGFLSGNQVGDTFTVDFIGTHWTITNERSKQYLTFAVDGVESIVLVSDSSFTVYPVTGVFR